MQIQRGRELQLGADSVGARDQDRLIVASLRQREEAAEAADTAEYLGSPGTFHGGPYPAYQSVTSLNVDSSGAVVERGGFLSGRVI